ncbi:hypothetical protein KOI35_18310 [Actinoplanes bogorensis]|uniref:Gram-positive cocci surface proteins LPxTG domain-containing protein n=1 Tax=Paractinoplanes bogorensis TaxID=1610840 RepID=A0ABS5YRV6_9ACTN|nr:hypothetical protein [Actinoplanes bogorensis]MBU2665464.1 hypothetical protein [Actinoplanes bogorensis]
MILRRLGCAAALAMVGIGVAATPAVAAAPAADLNVATVTVPSEVAPGYAYNFRFIGGRVGSAGAGMDNKSVRMVLTVPAGTVYAGPGKATDADAGPCTQQGNKITCAVTKGGVYYNGYYPFAMNLRMPAAAPVGEKLSFSMAISANIAETNPANDSETFSVDSVPAVDLGITATEPVIEGTVATYKLVVRNHGTTPVRKFVLGETLAGYNMWYGQYAGDGAKCQSKIGGNECVVEHELAPGGDYELTRTVDVVKNSDLRGEQTISPYVYDVPTTYAWDRWVPTVVDAANNKAPFTIDFTEWRPAPASPSPSVTPSATASPTTPGGTAAPAPGDGGEGGGGEGGGLPITGAPTLVVASAGVALLVVGAGVLLLTRRRRTVG